MESNNYHFTSEAVTAGHPDKICDAISDKILDEALKADTESRMAVECTIKDNFLLIYGEANTKADLNYKAIANSVLKEIGYIEDFNILVKIGKQSSEISNAVEKGQSIGAGDQGIMFGYACKDTQNYMPAPIQYANDLARKLGEIQKETKEQQIENLVDINKKYYKKNKKVNFFQQSTTIFFNYIYTLYLVYNILSYKIGISNFVTSMTGVNQLKYNLIGISQIIPSLIENIRYIKKMREILIMPKDNLDCGKSIDKIEQIEFKNVSFKYPNTDRYILKDISFNLYKGQTIALVGKNGIGKSTIIKLLCGLYSIDEGELLLNNVNIKNYNIDDIRKQIGVVFQSPKLFSFSILENILLTNNISKEDIERVNKELVRFDLNNKIDTLENGIYTNLSREFSNAGTFLSGGEYQKISILRSKIKKGSLYIFDEPTSSLDPITEKEIMRIITSELSESIKIFVTHRLSNLINFDKIYVLNKGRIIEFGTHEELMVRKGFYYEMYKAQNKFNED